MALGALGLLYPAAVTCVLVAGVILSLNDLTILKPAIHVKLPGEPLFRVCLALGRMLVALVLRIS